MTDERYERAKKLFLEVCDLSEAERAAILDRECAGDPELRAEVESLVAHHDPHTAETAQAGPEDPRPPVIDQPRRIGPYRVIRELGRGGMGVVYLGVREDDQFRRRVAIKVLKHGMDTEEILNRFELERQLLAALNHPGIARLYDGGRTDDGLPYFAMEYVEGQPIDDYCDTHRLRIGERLDLFRSVCAAVHYAHQNLVVHRDLKPGNIIVTKDGTPKLLDFGIAKLINPELTLIAGDPTAPELRIMTPEYASPEQARGDPISTASDIYTLGVVLYELVTGHRPYRLRSRLRDEVAHVICDVEPERPSTAVSRVEEIETDGAEPPGSTTTITPETVSRVREGKPDRLRRRLAGDIDNIVLMAMRKEPQRRYASAEQFAEDIRRHLEGMPVIARRDTAGYRAVKFVRRHRVGVAAVVAVALSLGFGFVGTSWGLVREKELRGVADAERQRAEFQRDLAESERDRADAALEMAKRYAALNVDLSNKLLTDFHDAVAKLDGSLPARELLVETAQELLVELSEEAKTSPEVRYQLALLHDRVGDIRGGFRNPSLGDTSAALEHYRAALEIRTALLDEHPGDVELQRLLSVSHMKIGDVLRRSGDTEGALRAYRRHLELAETVARADPDARRTVAIALANIGAVQLKMGRLEEAERSYRRSLALRNLLLTEAPDSAMALRDTSVGVIRVAEVLNEKGDTEGALAKFLEAVEYREQLAKAEPDSGRARRDLALVHYFAGDALLSLDRPADGGPHIDHFFTVVRQRAADNPASPRAQADLALAYEIQGRRQAQMGDLDAAMESYEECQELMAPFANSGYSTLYRGVIATSHERIAEVLADQGNEVGAVLALREALQIYAELSTEDADDAALQLNRGRVLSALGGLLLETGDLRGARQRLEEAQGILEELHEDQPAHAATRHELALALCRLSGVVEQNGDQDAAAAFLEHAQVVLDAARPGPRTTEIRRMIEDARGGEGR